MHIMETYDLHLQSFGGNSIYEFYSELAPTYLYLRSLTANLKVAMRKRFFVSAPQINLPCWVFLFFHTNSIWTQYIKLFWKIWITKNAVTTFYITLSFHPYIFRTKSLQGNRKKTQHPSFSLLESSIFVLVEKTGETAVSELKVVQVSKH